MHKPAASPAADWRCIPTTAWNYGLILDLARPERSVVIDKPIGKRPFTARRRLSYRIEDGMDARQQLGGALP